MSYIAAIFLYLYGGRHLKKCCRLHRTSCQQTRWKKTGFVSHSEACSFVTWPQCRCLMGSPMPRGLPMRFRSVDCLMYSKPQFILWLTISLCTASTGSPKNGSTLLALEIGTLLLRKLTYRHKTAGIHHQSKSEELPTIAASIAAHQMDLVPA